MFINYVHSNLLDANYIHYISFYQTFKNILWLNKKSKRILEINFSFLELNIQKLVERGLWIKFVRKNNERYCLIIFVQI